MAIAVHITESSFVLDPLAVLLTSVCSEVQRFPTDLYELVRHICSAFADVVGLSVFLNNRIGDCAAVAFLVEVIIYSTDLYLGSIGQQIAVSSHIQVSQP